MSLFKDAIKDIIYKTNNIIPLLFGEVTISNLYTNTIKKLILCENPKEIININEIQNDIQQILINEKSYIFKLLFSNGILYIPLEVLTKIEYFKNMIEYYNFGDSCIVEMSICSEIDNYDVMVDIFSYVECDDYEYTNTIFRHFYEFLIIIDYMGLAPNVLLSKLINEYAFGIKKFNGNTCDIFEKMCKILDNNKVNIKDAFIVYIWENIVDLDDDVDKIISLPIFKNVIMYSFQGLQYIEKHKKFQCFAELLNDKNYIKISIPTKYTELSYIINPLLDENTIETYEIIYNALKRECDKNIIYIMLYLERNVNKISEIIYNFNVSVFNLDIQLDLMIKHNKVEYITDIGEKILSNNNATHIYKLKKFICICNNIINLPDYQISPIKQIICTDHYGSHRKNILQIISYYPLNYKLWEYKNYVYKIIETNKVKSSIIIIADLKEKCEFNSGDNILVNGHNYENYNIMTIKSVERFYGYSNDAAAYYSITPTDITILENIDVNYGRYIFKQIS